MPTYIYKCKETGEEFEYFQSMNDDVLEFWPPDVPGYDAQNPKKIFRKIGSGSGLIFKGSGFYKTDYTPTTDSSSKPKTVAKTEPKATTTT